MSLILTIVALIAASLFLLTARKAVGSAMAAWVLGAAALVVGAAQPSFAEASWPKLDRASTDFVCTETLKYAKASFASTSFNLFAPVAAPANAASDIVAQASDVDISGGDSIASDKSIERIALKRADGSAGQQDFLHWSKDVTGGWRFIILSEGMGWRGNFYALYRIDSNLTQAAVVDVAALPKPVFEQNWRPPIILARRDNRAAWAVDVDQSFGVFVPWRVFPANGNKPSPTCEITFGPPFQAVEELLPPAVATLAKNLDIALGEDGPNAGTLQPVAHVRLHAKSMWANVALRPWAAAAVAPYNTRAEIDAELEAWGKLGENARVLALIKLQYPKAERALAAHYKKRFTMDEAEARRLAAKVLDLAYRSSFVFGTT